jgi:MoaA/NifB/PqqE/SkfB family radical SAM enzyme
MVIDELILEITRRCNMACDHCLRGDAEPIDMSDDLIKAVVSQVEYIGTIVFTGGEPSLVPKKINRFIDICEEQGVDVGNFYIVTNGKKASNEFLSSIIRLFAFVCDREEGITMLDVSNDIYHEAEGQDDKEIDKLKAFTFFNRRERLGDDRVIDMGRAYSNGIGATRAHLNSSVPEEEDGNIRGSLYINALGDIVYGCDYSYEEQKDFTAGNIIEQPLLQIIKEI